MKVILYFLKVILGFTFYRTKKNRIIYTDLFRKFSFRYTVEVERSFSQLPRRFKAALNLLWNSEVSSLTRNTNAKVIVYDGKYEEEQRREYLRPFLNEEFDYVVRGIQYSHITVREKLVITFMLCLIAPVIGVYSLFERKKANAALIFKEMVECCFLYYYARQHSAIPGLIIFSAYEKDISFISAFWKDVLKSNVQLVPSSNPINNFYREVICDTFTFTAPYQAAEFELLRENWIFESTIAWPPFGYEQVASNLKQYTAPPKLSLGYFSSGNWLREKLGHLSLGLNERESEKFLIESLKGFVQKNPHVNLVIYLHPLEKRKEHMELTNEFYNLHFGESLMFSPIDQASIDNFHLVDVGISVYSSTVFQRLFAGMKTLLAPFTMPFNYFSDARLEEISIRDVREFDDMLHSVMAMPVDQFFSQYKLKDYSYHSYPAIIKELGNARD